MPHRSNHTPVIVLLEKNELVVCHAPTLYITPAGVRIEPAGIHHTRVTPHGSRTGFRRTKKRMRATKRRATQPLEICAPYANTTSGDLQYNGCQLLVFLIAGSIGLSRHVSNLRRQLILLKPPHLSPHDLRRFAHAADFETVC